MDVLPEAADRSGAQVVYAAASARTLERIAAFCRERGLPVADGAGGAHGLRLRPVPDLRRAGRAQGRKRLRQSPSLHRRARLQPCSRAVGPMARRTTHDAADAAGGAAGRSRVAGLAMSARR